MTKTTILSLAEVAALIGVGEPSIRTYHTRASANRRTAEETGDKSHILPGDLPAPDGRISNTPYWYQATIEKWEETRPGRGGHNKEAHKRNLVAESRRAKKAE